MHADEWALLIDVAKTVRHVCLHKTDRSSVKLVRNFGCVHSCPVNTLKEWVTFNLLDALIADPKGWVLCE